MNKHLLITLLIFISGKLSADNIVANFENTGSDVFNDLKWTCNDGTLEIVENPSKSGINNSSKSLLNKRIKGSSSAWTESGDIFPIDKNPIIINDENRYFHIMVYSDKSYSGMVRFSYSPENNKWKDPAIEIRFDFKAGKWNDLVFDLKGANVTELHGLFFMSQDWSGNGYPTDCYFYYDEIVLNNDPLPRINSIITTGHTLIDFENINNEVSYTVSGSNGGTTFNVIENQDKKGVNYSDKCLEVAQTDEKVWWSRLNFVFDSPIMINSSNRYLHVMVKSPMSGLSLITYNPNEFWYMSNIPTRNEWCDVVFDLMSSSNNLNNVILSSFGICANSSTNIPDINWCIDDIEFNNSSKPRIGKPSVLDNITCSLSTADDDWTFIDRKPHHELTIKNNGKEQADFTLNIDVKTDSKEPFASELKDITLAAGESVVISHELINAIPGFYRYYIDLSYGEITRNKIVRQIGYKPEEIPCYQNKLSDFEEFWNSAKAELASVDPEYKVTFKRSTSTHNIYDVEMKSIKGNVIKGYYSAPKKEGKFPAIVFSNGFGMTAFEPIRYDDIAVFNYNIRGMGISTDYNAKDDVFVNGLSDINTYYYRECYMDAIRAVDFLCSRPEVNTDIILAEGESQGGALTFILASMDNRIKAASAMVPFLSDFHHYYEIKQNVNEISEWPMDLLNNYIKKYNLNKDNIFDNLSYFDIMNHADKIKCPLLMAVGLQDPVCPPHINFAAYNQVKGQKEYKIYKADDHYVDRSFIAYKDAWFKKIIDDLLSNVGTGVSQNNIENDIIISVNNKELIINNQQSKSLNIEIYDINGKLIANMKSKNNITKKLENGIYNVVVTCNTDRFVKSIIVF